MKGNVVILKSDKEINVLKAAKEQHIKIKSFCKSGFCGRCTVKVLKGKLSRPTNKEVKKLGEMLIKDGYRLACQAQFSGEIKLEV